MHTDAIWRACRIILDVRMHRGELTVEEATDFLVEQTSFERAERRAPRSQWYTYRPTYPLSYLLGRTLLLGLRADEQRRLGDALQPQGLPRHAAAQRVAADQLPPPAAGRRDLTATVQVIPAIDLEARPIADRLLAGRRSRHRRADRPAGADRRAVRGARRTARSTSSTSTARAPGRRPTSTRSARSPHGSPSRSRSPAASTRPRGSSSRSRPGRRGSC